jgi:hypothetical protein
MDEYVLDSNGIPVFCGDIVPGTSLSLFEQTWGISQNDCRNSNWKPYSFALLSIELTGTLYNNCLLGATDPSLDCDPNPKTGATVYCETNTPPRTVWEYGDGACDPSIDPYCKCDTVEDPTGTLRTICTNVSYLCVDSGEPIAWNDSYSVRPGGTLTVKDIGVLTNDHDTGKDVPPFTTFLTATPYTYVNDAGVVIGNVSHGTLTLNSRGGFKYIPDGGFTGVDSFTYRAYDGVNYSNVATVTITVTQ